MPHGIVTLFTQLDLLITYSDEVRLTLNNFFIEYIDGNVQESSVALTRKLTNKH